jgi:hypothetical protein
MGHMGQSIYKLMWSVSLWINMDENRNFQTMSYEIITESKLIYD